MGAKNGVPEEPQPRDGTNSERGIEGGYLGTLARYREGTKVEKGVAQVGGSRSDGTREDQD